jgi:hypothetical protein
MILISAVDAQILSLAKQIALENGLNLTAAMTKPFLKDDLARVIGQS